MKITVLIVIHYARSGITSLVTSQVLNADRDEFDFKVLLFQKDERMVQALGSAGIPVHCITFNNKWGLPGAILKYVRLVRSLKPAIVHTHSFLPRMFTLAAMFFLKKPTFKHISTFHSDYPYLHGRTLRDWSKRTVEMGVMRSRILVTFNSQIVREIVSGIYNLEQANTTLIYNGIPIRDSLVERKYFQNKLPKGMLNVLSVGRLSPQKNFSLLIDCWKNVVEAFPSAYLTIVGDGEDRGRLERLVTDAGLGNSVQLPGWKSNVSPYLEKADIFVLPSLYESFPITILEAGLYALPVIATDVGGVREIIQPKHNGILVPAGDRCILEEALLSLLNNPAMRANYANNLRRLVMEKFNIVTHIDRMQSLYRQNVCETCSHIDYKLRQNQ